jgi:hypothetical protein
MTEAAWWALLDADPASFPWPVLADWLEDRDDPRADAAREVCRRGWAPLFHQYEFHGWRPCWSWWLEGAADPPGPDDLPPGVFHALPRGKPADEWRDYPSASAACRALLDALTLDAPPRSPG